MSPYTAACICNSCQLTLPGPPLLTLFCHCTECRRTAGADYATLCPYRAPAVTIEKDNFASYTIKNIERFWCKTCGSNVFFKNHKLGLEVVFMSAITNPPFASDDFPGSDDPAWKPQRHIYYGSGIRDVFDGITKYRDSAVEFGGTGEILEDGWHGTRRKETGDA